MAITADRDERHALAAKTLDELDKAQQPKEKVLTNDMVDTVADLERKLHLRENCSEKEADIWARGVMSGMIQARDNGYLAPSAGMTDERPWMNEWQRNMCKKSKACLINEIEEERAENDRLRNLSPVAGLTVEEVKTLLIEVSDAMCWDFPPQEMRIVALNHGIDITAKLNSKNNVH